MASSFFITLHTSTLLILLLAFPWQWRLWQIQSCGSWDINRDTVGKELFNKKDKLWHQSIKGEVRFYLFAHRASVNFVVSSRAVLATAPNSVWGPRSGRTVEKVPCWWLLLSSGAAIFSGKMVVSENTSWCLCLYLSDSLASHLEVPMIGYFWCDRQTLVADLLEFNQCAVCFWLHMNNVKEYWMRVKTASSALIMNEWKWTRPEWSWMVSNQSGLKVNMAWLVMNES